MLSFVIPAYNEERYLPPTIAAIHAAARELGGEYEIVVADDASTDATATIAAAAGARVIAVSNRQIAKTRNDGAATARGDRLVFVDADTRVNAEVLRAAMAALDAGAVGGGAKPVFDADAPRYAHFAIALVTGSMRWMNLAAGCFVYCTRAAFEAAGRWDERQFAGEELFLSRALGREGRFVMLRETVLTSPRKFHGRTAWQTLWLSLKLMAQGFRGTRRRESTQFWYDGRR